MSKPIHPIRKMQQALSRIESGTVDRRGVEQAIARHVKPLLDALEMGHQFPENNCKACRLLTAWRAKL